MKKFLEMVPFFFSCFACIRRKKLHINDVTKLRLFFLDVVVHRSDEGGMGEVKLSHLYSLRSAIPPSLHQWGLTFVWFTRVQYFILHIYHKMLEIYKLLALLSGFSVFLSRPRNQQKILSNSLSEMSPSRIDNSEESIFLQVYWKKLFWNFKL